MSGAPESQPKSENASKPKPTAPSKKAAVRALIEGLVTAYQHEAPAMSSFSVDRHFSGILPFLTLDEKLPGADDVHLDPSNFTLPVPPVESPWPPSESSGELSV